MDYLKFKKIILNFLLIITFLSFSFCFVETIQAQEENSGLRILYQGNLLDGQGKPVEDGNYNMRFSIYDAEIKGNIIWQEEYVFYNAVSVKNSRFRIILGRINLLNLKIEQGPFWLAVSLGQSTESDEIVWSLGTEQRKKIMSLSEFLKQEGLGHLEEGGITEKEWEEIYKLLEEKMGQQPNLILLFDLEQMGTAGKDSDNRLFDILKTFINFISEKISELGDRIAELGKKLDEVLTKLNEITSVLFNMGKKIDRLYQVLVADKGLESGEPLTSIDEMNNYSSRKFERLVIKEGESSIRIFNESIKAESLIFISFLDDPGSQWWISEKVPGDSFSLSLKEPASKNLIFDYWILNEEEQLIQLPAPENSEEVIETEETIKETESTTTAVQAIEEETIPEENLPVELESEQEQEQEQTTEPLSEE